MINMYLVLKKQGEHRLLLQLPIYFRLAFAAIAVFLTFSMISTGSLSAAPLILAIISIIASLYQEKWIFDKKSDRVEHQFGLVIWFKRQLFLQSQIANIVLANYREEEANAQPQGFLRLRRTGGRSLISLALTLEDGRKHTIEIRRTRQGAVMKTNGQTLADFCEKPLIQE